LAFKTKKQSTALILVFAYLALRHANALAFDFHRCLATTLLAYLFYFMKKKLVFWLIWILFLGLQENFFF
jgi:hypothetical protein